MGVITVRPARRSDFLALEPIFERWHDGLVTVPEPPDRWLVADVDGVVAGGLLMSEFCRWDAGLAGFGHLTEDDVVPFASLLCVDESLRDMGVGTSLMTHWIESTPSWAHVIMPDASDDEASQAARATFFQRLGFTWMATDHEALEPWLMMRKSLPR